jgi:phenylpropionate dioxygenase-like ring-hydroxylating dioxygenase large terminal subunit
MTYSEVEKDGIRCLYHGWLFDACGKVVVRGSWVEGGEKRMEVGQPAYPFVEAGDFRQAARGRAQADAKSDPRCPRGA